MSLIEDNLNKVLSTLPQGVRLVAVSKFHPADAGQRLFGENRPQELKEKYALLPKDIEWHMIGHLQTNKVKYIAPFVAIIESLDSERLAETIDKEAAKCGRTIDCLLEIHVAREQTKSGWDFTELAPEASTPIPTYAFAALWAWQPSPTMPQSYAATSCVWPNANASSHHISVPSSTPSRWECRRIIQ